MAPSPSPLTFVCGIVSPMSRSAWQRTKNGLLVPRREFIRGGLASFAAALMTKALPGCDGRPSVDAGMDAGMIPMMDAGPDAGATIFPLRDIPDPPALRSLIAGLGPLGDPDANGVRL